MKKCLLLCVSFVLLFTFVFAKDLQNLKASLKYTPGVIIVKLKKQNQQHANIDAVRVFSELQSKYGVSSPEKLFTISQNKKMKGAEELERIYSVNVSSPTDVEALAKKIAQNQSIEYAEPDYISKVDAVPNDPLFNQIYPLSIVKADTAWGIQKGDSTVILAVLDTGVDWDHPDLAPIIWNNADEIPSNGIDDDGNGYIDDVRGWDFVNGVTGVWTGEDSTTEDNNPMDFNGHGTHVAGISAGATNNGIGISSLSWGCKVMPLRIGYHLSDGNGYGSFSFMAKAFVYAANNGASAANLSFGTSNSSVLFDAAIYAYKNGVVICNSAGNSNTDVAGALGAQPWALSVAATNSNDGKASYSSFNSLVDISAPGGDFSGGNNTGFLSTIVNPSNFYGGDIYTEFQGTSMASPFVMSLVGLVKSQHKTWTPAQIMFQITGTADNIDAQNPNYIGKLGFGRINALKALTMTPSAAKPNLQFIKFTIDDATGGNGNGILEPGENAKLGIVVRNDWGDAQNLTATLSTTHWTTNVTKASSNYGLLRGISVLDSVQRGSLNDDFGISISADAIPQIIPFTVTFSASGGYTKQFNFEIALGSRMLIVDDDDGIVNIEGYIKTALNSLGTVYDMWDHAKQGTPPASVLQNYQAVIWDCEWAFPSLDSSDRASLTAYLNAGGKLFLSGQDIGWDMADPTGNEFVASGGTSKTFFESYLKAKYISDDAATGFLSGVAGDTIGDGISLTRNQPGRGANQYPDVMDTINGSHYIFKYSSGGYNGRGGAIGYTGAYKLAYFGFGGFESITDSSKRVQVMEKILKWLFEYSLSVTKLPNTEDTSNPYPVNANVTSNSNVTEANLYWDSDGSFPFTKLAMTFSSGKYSASIPAQTGTKNVQYFALIKTSKGYLPYIISKFTVGPDVDAPNVVVLDTIQNSIRLQGPYTMNLLITDNIAVDTNNVVLKYSINNGSEQSVAFQKNGPTNFIVTLVPSSALSSGDIVSYYLTAKDVSVAQNVARYPASGVKQFIIGREIVDDFENINANKWDKGLWNNTSQFKFAGLYSFTDSPDSTYKPNTERTATILNGYNLSPFSKSILRFYRRNTIHSSDTFYVEASSGGAQWIALKKITNNNTTWTKEELSLNDFIGGSNTEVKIRLRFKSDGSNERDGIYVDDLEILTNDLTVGVRENVAEIPTEYSLKQNYPNPFNPTTTIKYSVPQESRVTLSVYDILGREVEILVNEIKQTGNYQVSFDASRLATGIYFYRISSNGFTDIKKMMLIK